MQLLRRGIDAIQQIVVGVLGIEFATREHMGPGQHTVFRGSLQQEHFETLGTITQQHQAGGWPRSGGIGMRGGCFGRSSHGPMVPAPPIRSARLDRPVQTPQTARAEPIRKLATSRCSS